MSDRLSEQALKMAQDAAHQMMDGHSVDVGERAVQGAIIDLVLKELRERRALDEHRRAEIEELIERRKADLVDLLRSRWPVRFARNCYAAAALGREYRRGYAAATYDEDYYDRDELEQNKGCVLGERCCCPHIDHTSDECYSAEMAEDFWGDAKEQR